MPTGPDLIAEQMLRELLSTKSHRTPRDPLYHYTTSVGLNGIIRSQHIRATHFMHLNDRDEITAGEKLVRSVAVELRDSGSLKRYQQGLCEDFIGAHEKRPLTRVVDVYVASLTEEGNDLSQWRAYGAQGGGYSVGIGTTAFADLFPVSPNPTMGVWLEKVEYDEKVMRELIREELVRVLDGLARYWDAYGAAGDNDHKQAIWASAMTVLFVQVGALVTRYKNAAFHSEREWRIVASPSINAPSGTVKFDLRTTGVVPYLEVPLFREGRPFRVTRIYVGPTQDSERGVYAAKQLARDAGVEPDLVVHSGIPLRA